MVTTGNKKKLNSPSEGGAAKMTKTIDTEGKTSKRTGKKSVRSDDEEEGEEDDIKSPKGTKKKSNGSLKGKKKKKAASEKKVEEEGAGFDAKALGREEGGLNRDSSSKRRLRMPTDSFIIGSQDSLLPANGDVGKGKKLNKKGKRYRFVCQRWQKAIVQTIKANLYKRLEDVHTGKYDKEVELKEMRENLAKGITIRKRARSDGEEAKRRAKRDAYETRLWRRVGHHHYDASQHPDALVAFNAASQLGWMTGEEWLMLARCDMELFKVDMTKPEYLEGAIQAYRHVLNHPAYAPESLATLPDRLMDIARVYERYGAFEGSLSILSLVIENFNLSPQMNDALLRSVIIMKHLATFPTAPKEDLLARCEEFLQRLMGKDKDRDWEGQGQEDDEGFRKRQQIQTEEPPPINEEFLTLLYARVCEQEGTPVGALKAVEAYRNLFELRKGRYNKAKTVLEKRNNNAGKYSTWKPWAAEATTWDELAQELAQDDEPILSIDMFQCRERIQTFEEVEPLLEVAKSYLFFQDTELAVYYGSRAWRLNAYDLKVREFLRKISENFREMFAIEEKAITKLQKRWRLRAWRKTYIEKHQRGLVQHWEAELKQRPYNRVLRDKLAYFAKSKWRAIFMYQELAASRIQSWYRSRMKYRKFRTESREKHVRDLALLFGKWRKKPLNPPLRAEVKAAAKHRFTPVNHRILQLLQLFAREEAAATKITATIRMWLAKVAFKREMEKYRYKVAKRQHRAATKLQANFRCLMAVKSFRRLQRQRKAALGIARFMQWRYRGWRCRMDYLRLKALRRKEAIERVEFEKGSTAATKIQKVWRGKIQRQVMSQWRDACVGIQKMLRGMQARRQRKRQQATAVLPPSRPLVATTIKTIETSIESKQQEQKQPAASKPQQSMRPPCRKDAWEQYQTTMMESMHEEEEEICGGDAGEADKETKEEKPGRPTRPIITAKGPSEVFKARVATAMVNGGVAYRYTGIFDSTITFCEAVNWTTVVFAPHMIGNPQQEEEDDPSTSDSPRPAQQFGSDDIILIANLLQYIHGRGCQLRSLVLCGADLSDEQAVTRLAAALVKNRSLASLAISDCQISLHGLSTIFKALLINYRIQEVLLDAMSASLDTYNERCVCRLASDYFMHRFGNLQSLALCRDGITTSGTELIARGVESSSCTLRCLILAENQISDEDGVLLAKALVANRSVTTVDLSSNRLAQAAGLAFARVVQVNTMLRSLILRGNKMEGDQNVLKAFLEAVAQRTTTSLKTLDLTENGFSPDEESLVQDALVLQQQALAEASSASSSSSGQLIRSWIPFNKDSCTTWSPQRPTTGTRPPQRKGLRASTAIIPIKMSSSSLPFIWSHSVAQTSRAALVSSSSWLSASHRGHKRLRLEEAQIEKTAQAF